MNRLAIFFIWFFLSPIAAYAGGPHSLSFGGGWGSFQNSPYFQASSKAGLGDRSSVVTGKATYEYRLNPNWSVEIDIPYVTLSSWPNTGYQAADVSRDVGHDVLFGIVPKYFFVKNGTPLFRKAYSTMDAYVGVGPRYANIFEVRPGAETNENKWGVEFLTGIELFTFMFSERLGFPIEFQYLLFPKISTPLGNLNVSGYSVLIQLRYHFGE
jgi:hypothetical protein